MFANSASSGLKGGMGGGGADGEGADGGEPGDAWGDDLELDLGDVVLPGGGGGGGGYYVAPTAGMPIAARWCRESGLAADHAAAGSFESAMMLLRRQLGVMDFVPLKPLFLALAGASHAVAAGAASAPPLVTPLRRAGELPRACLTLPALVERLKAGYVLFTNGKFQEAHDAFAHIVSAICLTVVEVRSQVGELKELLGIAREYLTALRLELLRKRTAEPQRQIELAAYFTHCNLQAPHVLLSLRSAMTAAFKLKLLNSAAGFARRLLELNPKPDISTQARKVIQLAEATPTDAFTYAYDERNPFVLCNADFTPIYRGSALVRCTYCKAPYGPAHKGSKCATCALGEVGGDAAGLDEKVVLSLGNTD